jgi:hypothetical protein
MVVNVLEVGQEAAELHRRHDCSESKTELNHFSPESNVDVFNGDLKNINLKLKNIQNY